MEKLHDYPDIPVPDEHMLRVYILVEHIGYVRWRAATLNLEVIDRDAWWALGQLIHRLYEQYGRTIIESIKIDGFERLREEKVWIHGRPSV